MHQVVKEPRKRSKSILSVDNLQKDIENVSFTTGIEHTLVSGKLNGNYLEPESLATLLKVQNELYAPEHITEQTVIGNFYTALQKIKDKIIALILAFFPSKRSRKSRFRKNKLSPKSKRMLGCFKDLAGMYVMYCHSDEEITAYEFAFSKMYYDLVTNSKNKGYDKKFFSDKMDEFISVFEP